MSDSNEVRRADVVLVGAGIGLTPILSIAHELTARGARVVVRPV
mgnify:CR=1 FL=1